MTDLHAIAVILFFQLAYQVVRDAYISLWSTEHPDPAVREYLKKHNS